jgi:putative hydrolase of the HAD superfamily
MEPLRAVLFDVGDTLFHRRSGHLGVVEAAAALGADVDPATAERLWNDLHARASTPEELAKGRDLSAEAHRAGWTALYGPLAALAPGLPEAMYEREIDAAFWEPFPDTIPTLRALHRRGIRIGVVSDAGFDVRSFFVRHGVADLVSSFVLSFEHGAAKPAAKLFDLACQELEVEPAEALMVGDNPLTDGGAVQAGLTCLLLPPARPGEPRGFARVLAVAAG